MTKKLLFIFLILFLFQTQLSLSQENTNELIDGFVIAMNKAGLSKSQADKVKDLIIERDRLIVQDLRLQKELNSKYPFVFHDEETTTKYSNQQFVGALSEIISVEQFKKLFLPQLETRIQILANDKLNLLKKRYRFTTDQETKLKKLLYETTANEIIIKEYYNYNDSLSWNNYTEEKIKSSDKERELLKSFGLFYSKNPKTDVLIKNLQEAKIDTERINLILKAIQTEQERQDKREKTWRENQKNYVVQFHDEGDVEDKIRMDFRQELCTILRYEEFKTVFASQMQNRIKRESDKEFQIIKAAYKLTDQQYDEIQKLVLEKNTEKIITEEYYKYNYELCQQKLRAVEYRHEKFIRETIQKYNVAKF